MTKSSKPVSPNPSVSRRKNNATSEERYRAAEAAPSVSHQQPSDRIVHLPLKSIRTDLGTQMRTATSEKVVDEYCDLLDVLDDFDPVMVFEIALGGYVLADGFHRHSTYLKKGRDMIPCVIRQGSLDDAREYACCANQHGLSRTNEDKRKAVGEFLKIPGRDDLPNKEVARRLGVTGPLVQKVRDLLGIKPSPAAHHGAGAKKQGLNNLILMPPEPDAQEGMTETSSPVAKNGNDTITVALSTKNVHKFTIAIVEHFDQEFLKSLYQYLHKLFNT